MIGKMKFFVWMGALGALLMVSRASFAANGSALKEAEGKTYYTAVNIWYEDPKEIPSTNYHKGQLLPINTQVKIGTMRKNSFTFTDGDNVEYTIQIVRKHTPIPNEELFNRYFSRTKIDLGQFFGKFNKDELKNIEAGTIAVGMSKRAVIAAYGYPPSHMTPSLEKNPWKYWESRFSNFYVFFKDGKVSRVGNAE